MKQLYPHQLEAVEFIKSKKKCILADDMGLGKTLSSVVAVNELGLFPVLVLCPAAVKKQWLEEIQSFTEDVGLMSSTNPCLWNKYVIVPYTQLDAFMEYWNYFNYKVREGKPNEWVSDFKFFKRDRVAEVARTIYELPPMYKSALMDEAHITRRNTSNQSASVKEVLGMFKPAISVFLSGTPVVNKPTDVMDMLAYCDFYEKEDTKYIGEFQFLVDFGQNNKEFNKELSDKLNVLLNGKYMLRREKSILNLPEKVLHKIVIPIDTLKYEKEKSSILGSRAMFSTVNKLYTLTGELKIKGAVKKINEIKKDTDGKIIVFAYHKEVQHRLANLLKCKVYNTASRAPMFKKSKDKIAVMSLKACGTGINLQFCSTVIFAELFWTPAELEQAENRVHRIGQEHKVNVYYLVADGGLDSHLVRILEDKEKYINYTVRQAKVMLFQEISGSVVSQPVRVSSSPSRKYRKKKLAKAYSPPPEPLELGTLWEELKGLFSRRKK